MTKYVVVLLRGPGPDADFVELEDDKGRSANIGEWVDRGDGYHVLRIPLTVAPASGDPKRE